MKKVIKKKEENKNKKNKKVNKEKKEKIVEKKENKDDENLEIEVNDDTTKNTYDLTDEEGNKVAVEN